MKYISDKDCRLAIKSWCNFPEDGAIEQAKNMARLPFAFHHIGLMPDVRQGTSSYIVRGIGNKESFMSCSHGAGRRMGRGEARRTLNLAAEQKKLNDRGILHSIRNESDLDEASGAYKDIETVMEEQSDLVEILFKLEPLGVIKG